MEMHTDLTALKEVVPIGPLDNLSDKKMADLRLVPTRQIEPLALVPSGMPILVHQNVQSWLDSKLGPAFFRANMEPQRRGEPKLIRNIIDAHNRWIKKSLIRKGHAFSQDTAYICVHLGRGEFEDICTIQTIGRGINAIQVIMINDIWKGVDYVIKQVQATVKQKYIDIATIELISEVPLPAHLTDWFEENIRIDRNASSEEPLEKPQNSVQKETEEETEEESKEATVVSDEYQSSDPSSS